MMEAPASLTPAELALYSFQLVDSVCWLHEQRILHRDLKPQHILEASPSRQIVIIDFGHSEFIPLGRTIVRGLAGTPGMVAPELGMPEEFETFESATRKALEKCEVDGFLVDTWAVGNIILSWDNAPRHYFEWFESDRKAIMQSARDMMEPTPMERLRLGNAAEQLSRYNEKTNIAQEKHGVWYARK